MIAELHSALEQSDSSLPTALCIGGVDVFASADVTPGTFRWARRRAPEVAS